jgi:hypothetical protein
MSGELVTIKTFVYRHEAEMAQSFLKAYGIPSMVSADDCGGWNPYLVPLTGGACLMVRRDCAEDAIRLLEPDPVWT